jgi:hypothetical protein
MPDPLQPQSLEDLLEESQQTGTPQNIEDLFAESAAQQENVAAGRTPLGLTPEEQAEGREFYKGTLPRAVATTAGGMVGGVPGSMIGAGAGELLTGRGPKQAVESALLTGAFGKLTNLGIRGLGYLGGVKQRAITPVLRAGPKRTIRAISKPAGTAEETAALSALEATRKFTKPGGEFPAMRQAEAALKTLDEKMAAAHAKPARRILVDKIDEMIAARTPAANPEEQAANAQLERFKKFVPELKDATGLNDWLRRIRGPIKAQLGKPGAPLHANDIKEMQAFTRAYRDTLLGGPQSEGAQAFAKSSRQIQAAKDLQKIIADPRGNLKPGAEAAWRRVISDKNHVTRRAMENFDALTGSKITQEAEALAMRRLWNPEDAGNAVFILSMIARAVRETSRVIAKTGAVVRPLVPAAGTALLTAEEEKK